MTSLMQKFAETREQRLQERAIFLENCEQARQERLRDFQAQSVATAEYLAHGEQNRLAGEQGRQAIAEIALESRLEEIENRVDQVTQYLQVLNINRTEQATTDSLQRAQDVRTRTFKMRSQLKHIHKARIRAGQADLVQRQQVVQERAALTQMQIDELTQIRLANASVAAQQRAQEFSDRVADVKDSLAQLEVNRLAEAEVQASRLRAFRVSLSESVWAGTRSVASSQASGKVVSVQASTEVLDSPSSKSKKKNSKSESVSSKPTELPVVKPVEVKEIPRASGKIQQFVVDYVAQLSTNSSLLEVVNDRDTVRDLLAQGANTLKVDPSDILNTLLQMAEDS